VAAKERQLTALNHDPCHLNPKTQTIHHPPLTTTLITMNHTIKPSTINHTIKPQVAAKERQLAALNHDLARARAAALAHQVRV